MAYLDITARYTVVFVFAREGEDWRRVPAEQTTVVLSEGYSTFEDMRKILAVKRGGKADDVTIVSAYLQVDPAEAL